MDLSSSDSSSSSNDFDQGLFIGMIAVATDLLCDEMSLEEEEEKESLAVDLSEAVWETLEEEERSKRQRNGDGNNKREYIKYDRQRAKECVMRDYMGPSPLFRDHQFERFFRITKTQAEQLLSICAHNTLFFRTGFDCTGCESICPKVKLLMALKMIAFGSSGSAFQDYFQMGLSTARLCFKNFCAAISTDTFLCETYLRQMTRSDAVRVTQLHLDNHGVEGMLGSLDCCHFYWKNCPIGWQGAFKGKEKHPSIVLEAFSDFNLWIWHSAFGYAGSLNDINIWDQSPLLESFLDGSFAKEVDFDFTVDGKTFHRLWLMTDGIYPEIARFVKTIDEAVTPQRKRYAGWQESCRKDIERAFGVLQRKFLILTRPLEQWFLYDIKEIVNCCLILHNMMVEHRVEKGEREGEHLYQTMDDDEPTENINLIDPDEENLATRLAEQDTQQRIETNYYHGNAVDLTQQTVSHNSKIRPADCFL